ncbi:MAG: hypothetical protein K0S61_1374 [Anaerocolumna sp.]|jgi:diadenosine tetraphosphate (Ap4A) HIT family hydrolase|nr:hypothetical protein [Anaerocolumna sp.]
MIDWKIDRIESAIRGENPTVITRMKSGFAVIGDTQFLPGYCVLLGYPKVFSLNDLSPSERTDFLMDMTLIGDAIMEVYKPIRINYEILGNTDIFLHAHIFPRYEHEGEYKYHPVWNYPKDRWTEDIYQYDELKDGALKKQLMDKLNGLMGE